MASAPPPLPAGAVRFAVGGDSRRGVAGPDPGRPVLEWAFQTAGRAGAAAFFYLGDMELSPPADSYFRRDLGDLRVKFCPVYGNHEALVLGVLDVTPASEEALSFTRAFVPRCLAREELPLVEQRAHAGRVYYATDLPGDVHFVALDNVSPGLGFGEAQLLWLSADLASARARRRRIVVGMHKALAGNGVTGHSMDEDAVGTESDRVRRESHRALRLFQENGVELVVASHEHGYWEFRQPGGAAGIRTFITGGLGAPLKTCAGPDHAFYHLLLVDVTPERIDVTPVRWPGP